MSRVIVMKEKYNDEFLGEITDELDKFMLDGYSDLFKSYIMAPRSMDFDIFDPDKELDEGLNLSCGIRVPGATRGGIEVGRDGVIVEFHFYEDTSFGKCACYKREIREAVKKYIGCTLKFIERGEISGDVI